MRAMTGVLSTPLVVLLRKKIAALGRRIEWADLIRISRNSGPSACSSTTTGAPIDFPLAPAHDPNRTRGPDMKTNRRTSALTRSATGLRARSLWARLGAIGLATAVMLFAFSAGELLTRVLAQDGAPVTHLELHKGTAPLSGDDVVAITLREEATGFEQAFTASIACRGQSGLVKAQEIALQLSQALDQSPFAGSVTIQVDATPDGAGLLDLSIDGNRDVSFTAWSTRPCVDRVAETDAFRVGDCVSNPTGFVELTGQTSQGQLVLRVNGLQPVAVATSGQSLESLLQALAGSLQAEGRQAGVAGSLLTIAGACSISLDLTDPLLRLRFGGLSFADTGFIPTLSIDDVSMPEGHQGKTEFKFTVTLKLPPKVPVEVSYSTKDGTAGASDYKAKTDKLTFNPGTPTSRPVIIDVSGDKVPEADETFFVQLQNPVNALLLKDRGTGTIWDDDGNGNALRLKISAGANVAEGNAGAANKLTFTVELSGTLPAGVEEPPKVTVKFFTADGGATGVPAAQNNAEALVHADYRHKEETLTFDGPRLPQFRTVKVDIIGDGRVEPNETVFGRLRDAVNAAIVVDSAKGTILDDDRTGTLPKLSIEGPAQQREGDQGAKQFTFTVTLFATGVVIEQPVTVDYFTEDGTARGIAEGKKDKPDKDSLDTADYQHTQGTLTFPAAGSQEIKVTVFGDTNFEPTEQFFVRLRNAVNAEFFINGDSATGIIGDDDVLLETMEPILVKIDSPEVAEGNKGKTTLQFTVSVMPPEPGEQLTEEVKVKFRTRDVGSATSKGPEKDYHHKDGTLTFKPGGPLSQTITVEVVGDTNIEDDESFLVVLETSPPAVVESPGGGVGTITNDD